ncbi:hypothetical protein MSAN_00798400 [Mycena sanguinolenta]|uniref:Uncharacterized protein n=1 Tax=Mycena sanguinolenta TaxID=230812 RepID=A0A8H7DAI7_9AGAR|nr:hypothetical protein MSAN_00798400 [Mycena sanguinolenta]
MYDYLLWILVSSAIAFWLESLRRYRNKPFRALHRKAWGHPWPRRYNTISRAEIGRLDDGDEIYVNVDDGVDHFDYCCLEDIEEVCRALAANTGLQDVIVMRQEYEEILSRLYHYPPGDPLRFKLFVITGQQGIGKTCFLVYHLLYRLERRLPTAVQVDNKRYFIFDHYGATLHSTDAASSQSVISRLNECWVLCDSNSFVTQPCEELQAYAATLMLTTLPKPEWRKMMEKMYAADSEVLVVDLPTVMEIAAAVKELKLDTTATLGWIGKWGPTFRTIISLLRRPGYVDRMHSAVEDAANTLTNSPLTTAVINSDVGRLPTESSSSLLFVGLNHERKTVLCIPTRYLADIFTRQVSSVQKRASHPLTQQRDCRLVPRDCNTHADAGPETSRAS